MSLRRVIYTTLTINLQRKFKLILVDVHEEEEEDRN